MEEDRGFSFPGRFRITTVGPVDAELPMRVPATLASIGLVVHHDSLAQRASSGGRYLSVSVDFDAGSRADYEAAHTALRDLDGVKWTV